MNKEKARLIIEILSTLYEDKPALEFSSHFELLIAVILSAQCTDKRVNLVTRELFKIANTPQAIIALGKSQLEEQIKTCGLYKSKAKNIIGCCEKLIEKFDGVVPCEISQLQELGGVGKKTANVVYSVGFGGDAIAVDTHVFRVANKTGLACGKNPLQVEKQLCEILDKTLWSKAHHYMIYHGRAICKAGKCQCVSCAIAHLCEYGGKTSE